MQFFNFTPQEIKALLFLLIAVLIGSGVTFYKKYHSSFAPELILERPSPVPFENQSQFNEDPKDTESHSQDASPTHADPRLGKRVDISPHEISKGSTTSPISNQQKENRISSIHENPLLKITPFDKRRVVSEVEPPKAGEKKIDLNSASAYQLELLPGIGPVLSLRIINHRETKGKFQKIEDVMKVSGIGPKTFEKIKDLITVE
jgi:competence protein ComEA